MRPRLISYLDISQVTLSPGITFIRYIRILPDKVHKIVFPATSSGPSSDKITLNIVLGKDSATVPSTSKVSLFLLKVLRIVIDL